MVYYLFRGILIGLMFGVPVGAVGTMTVQRTWNDGIKAGLLTGLGSSAADCVYASVGAFGLTFISDFLLRYQTGITIIGGLLVLSFGIRLWFQKAKELRQQGETKRGARLFFSSFAIGITNPAAILTFIFAFSYLEIFEQMKPLAGISLVFGVFTGTYFWWIILTVATSYIQKRTEKFNFRCMNQIFGSILCLFGALILFRVIF